MTSVSAKTINAPALSVLDDVKEQLKSKVVLSCMIGNALEWYDFAIYAFFADTIGKLFFPQSDPVTQIFLSFGIFAVGFLARPLGAIVFGIMGDRVGRKEALLWSIYLMAIPTTLIGLTPTFETIGYFAPILLIIFRLFQGFALGGEFTGSIVFLVEHAKPNGRGLAGSWASFSLILGILMGSFVIALLNCVLTVEQVASFGWRFPFLISILGTFLGIYMRKSIADPEVFQKQQKQSKSEKLNFVKTIKDESKGISVLLLIDFMNAVGFFMVIIFMPVFFKSFLKIPADTSQIIHTLNLVVFALMNIIGGILSDRYGRKPLITYPAVFLILFSVPLFSLFEIGNYASAFLVHLILCICIGLFFGALPSILCEIFPTKNRFSGVSIGHNISMCLFGGTTPMVATHLIDYTGALMAPVIILIIASMLTLLGTRYFSQCQKESNF